MLSSCEYFSEITAPDSPWRSSGNHRKTCPRGTGKENESSKYRQWPLQTPSMINVKGFLFLICQSFQGSLTYAYFQPQRSHHSSRWSGTSKPITTRLCWGWCCQSCKLAHLQPFIMHCSKEQHVFSGRADAELCNVLQMWHIADKPENIHSNLAGVTFVLFCNPLCFFSRFWPFCVILGDVDTEKNNSIIKSDLVLVFVKVHTYLNSFTLVHL